MTTCTVKQTATSKSLLQCVLESKAMTEMARLFSAISGESVSTSKALHIVNATFSFGALIVFGGCSLMVALLMLCWFGVSVYQCAQKA